MRLRPEKTKLQAFCTSYSEIEAYYAKTVSPITMEGNLVNFVEKAGCIEIYLWKPSPYL